MNQRRMRLRRRVLQVTASVTNMLRKCIGDYQGNQYLNAAKTIRTSRPQVKKRGEQEVGQKSIRTTRKLYPSHNGNFRQLSEYKKIATFKLTHGTSTSIATSVVISYDRYDQ